jgi:hypothetical protein
MKAIAMKATQEDWDSVKDLVKKYKGIASFKGFPYLVTNYMNVLGLVSNNDGDYKDIYNRTVYETFDRSIFLDALDIIEEKILDRNNLEIKYAGCDDWHEYSGSSQFRLKPINHEVKQLQELADKLGYKIEKL